MLQVRGEAAGTILTGTLYEEGEEPPEFRGAPDGRAPFVWVCDEFYQVESGGTVQRVDGEEVRVAFESPMPRGFDSRDRALLAAREHIRTQFARIGVDSDDVEITVERDVDAATADAGEGQEISQPDEPV
jgi:hypothetical protein